MVALRKLWNMFVSLCVVAALLLAASFIMPRFINLKPYIVTSGSMEPEFPVGSMIYVKHIDPVEIQLGDAITFYMPGTNIVATHEVYEIDEQNQQFHTQGINNLDENGAVMHDAEPVSFDSYIGKPLVCIPYLGYINQFCTSPPTSYFVLAAAVAIVALSLVIDAIPTRKSDEG